MADRDPPAPFLEHAAALAADLRRAGVEFECARRADGTWDYRGADWTLERLAPPPVAGDVQYDNAAACLAAVEAMHGELPVERVVLDPALRATRLPGRLQRVWIGDVEWLFDVAHNPAAVAVLAAELAHRPPAGRTLAIVGLMADKDVGGVLGPLARIVDEWLVTRAETERASEPQALTAVLERLGRPAVRVTPSVASACELATARAGHGDRVVTFGSFHVVGPAMAALELYSVASSPGDTSAKWTGV